MWDKISESTNYYLVILIKIIFIIVFWRIAIFILNKVINKFFRLSPKFKLDEKKANTLTGLMKSLVKYTIYTIMIISVLNVMKIPTESILAAAGIGGLAIGFGAQNLVKDVIIGFFILFEDQYGVGDYVTIGSATGTIEEMGLRITKLRRFNGDLHIIPNGDVETVINHSRGNSLAIVDINVAYETEIDRAISILKGVGEIYYSNNKDRLVEEPQVLGVTDLDESSLTLRMIARTVPLKHWAVERELRKSIKDALEKENIEAPYPRRIYINKDQER